MLLPYCTHLLHLLHTILAFLSAIGLIHNNKENTQYFFSYNIFSPPKQHKRSRSILVGGSRVFRTLLEEKKT